MHGSPIGKGEAYMQTFTGKMVAPLSPHFHPSDVNIEDVAQSLSNQCRFGGHCLGFYSVAEHCLHVSKLAEGLARDGYLAAKLDVCFYSERFILQVALYGLLHDASETYLKDMVRPLKPRACFAMTDDVRDIASFKDIENILDIVIAFKFGIRLDGEEANLARSIVKHCDQVALATERRDLMEPTGEDWNLPEPDEKKIETLAEIMCLEIGDHHGAACNAFTERYNELSVAILKEREKETEAKVGKPYFNISWAGDGESGSKKGVTLEELTKMNKGLVSAVHGWRTRLNRIEVTCDDGAVTYIVELAKKDGTLVKHYTKRKVPRTLKLLTCGGCNNPNVGGHLKTTSHESGYAVYVGTCNHCDNDHKTKLIVEPLCGDWDDVFEIGDERVADLEAQYERRKKNENFQP